MGEIADLILEGYDPEEAYFEQVDAINSRWKRGQHMLKDGKCIAIKDMETSHIQNCVNLWSKNKHYDLSPFKKELKKRT